MLAPLKTILLYLALSIIIPSKAQIDTISLATNDLVVKNLKPGLHQYLVYFEKEGTKKISNFSVWNRQVNFKTINGKEVIEIIQQWYSNDTTFNRYVYSTSKKQNFEPIYHYTKSSRGIEGFNFNNTKITGADSVEGNSKNGFEVAVTSPTLNWELDLEIFNTLPIKKIGQRFIIPFYHPGGRTSPKHYEYTVIGSEKITVPGGDGTMDCWQLKINYGDPNWAIFWLSKDTKEVIKMLEHFKGGYRHKVRTSTPIN